MWCARPAMNTNIQDITREEIPMGRCYWRLRRAVRAAVLRVVPEWFHQWFHRTICVRLWSRKERP
jgi:hypothetical protein